MPNIKQLQSTRPSPKISNDENTCSFRQNPFFYQVAITQPFVVKCNKVEDPVYMNLVDHKPVS